MHCDLPMSLHRAGVRLFWSFEQNAYIVESKYITRWSASGRTEDEALQAYGLVVQEPANWYRVAEEFFQKTSEFRKLDFEFKEEISEEPGEIMPMLIGTKCCGHFFNMRSLNQTYRPAKRMTVKRTRLKEIDGALKTLSSLLIHNLQLRRA